MARFQHHVAPSVIAERKQRAEEAEEQKKQHEDAVARADALMSRYREMDEVTRKHEAAARERSEAVSRQFQTRERLAQQRADEIEQTRAVEERANQILYEREALRDPQVASAYVSDSAIPRLEGDAPRMAPTSSHSAQPARDAAEAETLYLAGLGGARIVRFSDDPVDHGRVLDEQLNQLHQAYPLVDLLVNGQWEQVRKPV